MNLNQNRTIVSTLALSAVTAVLLTANAGLAADGSEDRDVSRATKAAKTSPTTRQAEALGAQFVIVPSQKVAGSDGVIGVDVFVKDVENVRTVQVAVDGFDGNGNALTLTSLSQDTDRADFLFAGGEVINAADANYGRIGALLFNDVVSTDEAKYFGTFHFAVDEDAAGSYRFSVRPKDSFMAGLRGQDLVFKAPATTVRVGDRPSADAIR